MKSASKLSPELKPADPGAWADAALYSTLDSSDHSRTRRRHDRRERHRHPHLLKEDHMQKEVLIPGPDHPITITPTTERVVVRVGEHVIAETEAALTLSEASYAPVQYLPIGDVDATLIEPSDSETYCPYKGDATYYSINLPTSKIKDAIWRTVDRRAARGHPDRGGDRRGRGVTAASSGSSALTASARLRSAQVRVSQTSSIARLPWTSSGRRERQWSRFRNARGSERAPAGSASCASASVAVATVTGLETIPFRAS